MGPGAPKRNLGRLRPRMDGWRRCRAIYDGTPHPNLRTSNYRATGYPLDIRSSWAGQVHAGRADEAIRLGADAVESAQPGQRALLLVGLGASYLAAGRSTDALPAAVQALELSRSQADRRTELNALKLLGDIELCAASLDFTAARSNLETALRLATELGLRRRWPTVTRAWPT